MIKAAMPVRVMMNIKSTLERLGTSGVLTPTGF